MRGLALVDLAIESNTPLDLDRPGYNDLEKIEVVVDALSNEVEQPAPPIEEVFTNDYVDEIGDGL